jgi:hypothetical protein
MAGHLWVSLIREVSKMKSLIVIMGVLVTVFVFSTAGLAYSNQQSGQYGLTEQTYAGRITSINKAGDRVVVYGSEGDKSFVLANAALNGLRLNEMVAVNYAEKDGRLIASFVGAPEYGYTGRITSINQAGDRIIVSGAEGDKSFVLANAALNGLRLNEMVAVNYAEKDGRLIASFVGAPQPYRVSKELEEHFRDEMRQS